MPLFWTSGGVSSGFQGQSGSLIRTWQRHACCVFPVHMMCFTSITLKYFMLLIPFSPNTSLNVTPVQYDKFLGQQCNTEHLSKKNYKFSIRVNPHRASVSTLALPLGLAYIVTLGNGSARFSSVTIDQY